MKGVIRYEFLFGKEGNEYLKQGLKLSKSSSSAAPRKKSSVDSTPEYLVGARCSTEFLCYMICWGKKLFT